MPHHFYVSSAGAMARMRQLEVLSNNLANANTVGFKQDRTLFETELEARLRQEDGSATPGAPGVAYVKTGDVQMDMTPGAFYTTGSPLDVAIQGRGLFEVLTEQGVRYTRAGSFVTSRDNFLVTPAGYNVMGDGGPIEVGLRPIHITGTGEIVNDVGETLGQLRVVDVDPAALEKEGSNLFRLVADAATQPIEEYSLMERSLEASNVQPVRALASLMTIQRAFEASLQALKADDEATQQLIQEVSS